MQKKNLKTAMLTLMMVGTGIGLAGCGNSQPSVDSASSVSSIDFSKIYGDSDANGATSLSSSASKTSSSSTSSSSVRHSSANTSSHKKATNVIEHNTTSNGKDTDSTDYSTTSGHKMDAQTKRLVTNVENVSEDAINYQMAHNIGTTQKPDSDKQRAVAVLNALYADQGHTKANDVSAKWLANTKTSLLKSNDGSPVFTKAAVEYASQHISNDAKALNKFYHQYDIWNNK